MAKCVLGCLRQLASRLLTMHLEVRAVATRAERGLFNRSDDQEVECTIFDSTVYDAISRLDQSGTVASRAQRLLLTDVNHGSSDLQDLAPAMEDLLDRVRLFTNLVDKISSVRHFNAQGGRRLTLFQ